MSRNQELEESGKNAPPEHITEILCRQDIEEVERAQRDTALRFEKTSEMVHNANLIVGNHYSILAERLNDHTNVVMSLKNDMDTTYVRLKVIKQKMTQKHPELIRKAEAEILKVMPPHDDF
ncbi:unnamed protein product [Oikopleura dioica]|uniref:KxDL motif-containing protein 1 n=1 Tax=Oikopleura dioica TaxID=34765 RepID=E4X100_OIKDI|nr:unnamed protein product [Oikopleura dioica]